MLLIFFLVTTSLDTEKGLSRQLPPPPRQDQKEEMMVKEGDLLSVSLDADDHLSCDGKMLTLEELTAEVEKIVAARPTTHVISVAADRNTSYDAYFKMQNAIVAGYNTLRDGFARKQLGHPYRECTDEEKEIVVSQYPLRISEAEPGEVASRTAAPDMEEGGEQ